MDAGFYGSGAGKTKLTERISNAMEAAEAEGPKAKRNRSRLFNPFWAPLLGPAMIWKPFPVQSEALEYCKANGPDVHVFAFECADLSGGKRRFLVTSYEHFWHDYMLMDDDQRALYEVIPEDTPVKLYFDLEYVKDTNPEANAEEIIAVFLSALNQTFTDVFNVPLPVENLVQLDSSNASKFSQHFIFPKVVFQDFRHAGYFVTHFCRRLQAEDCPEGAKKLLVHSKDIFAPRVLFIDQGVYTKNRNFRLYLSSKLGKNSPFVLYQDSPLQDLTPKEIFFLSLICNTRTCKKEDLLHFDTEKFPLGNPSQGSSQRASGRFRSDDRPSQSSSNLPSPFPELDKFFESVITADGFSGRIRLWQYFEESQTVLYSISGEYKYCGRIGRPHRSNNINFVACLKSGTYYQKCLDIDCKNYRSQDYDLPVVLINAPVLNESAVSEDLEDTMVEESVNVDSDEAEAFSEEGDELLADMPLPDEHN